MELVGAIVYIFIFLSFLNFLYKKFKPKNSSNNAIPNYVIDAKLSIHNTADLINDDNVQEQERSANKIDSYQNIDDKTRIQINNMLNDILNILYLENNQKTLARKRLIVPYKEKDEAKELGARWDSENKTWYVPKDKPLVDFRQWYTLSKECGQDTCESCGEYTLHYLDIQIRNNYKCFKCTKDMKILLIFFTEYDSPQDYMFRNELPIISEFAYEKPLSLIPFARKFQVFLKKTHSQTTKNTYVSHICPHCGLLQGDHYIVQDLCQDTKLIEEFTVSYCAECGKWKAVFNRIP